MRKKLIQIFFIIFLLTISLAVSFGQNKAPKTVRDYFKLVPSEYFNVHCCDGNKDAFIKKYVDVLDTQNGFMKGADLEEDPRYSGFVLKVFPSGAGGKTILGLYSSSIRWQDYYFLEYKNGKLLNISKTIPSYSTDNIYEFPRAGSIVKVYKKKYSSPTKEINVDETVERGKYLYSLVWQNGKFTVKK
jgi:hypothetical protein